MFSMSGAMKPKREAPLTVAVLAGGESRRMGREKGSLMVAGIPMLVRVLDAALATGLPVAVVGRSRIAALDGYGRGKEVLRLTDDVPGSGPLGAIATALRATGGMVLGVACDMPRLTPEAILWLADRALSAGDRHGVATLNGGRPEPLFSTYSPSVLPLMESLFARGERALHALITAGDFAHIAIPDDHLPALLNINTPDDLRGIGEGGR